MRFAAPAGALAVLLLAGCGQVPPDDHAQSAPLPGAARIYLSVADQRTLPGNLQGLGVRSLLAVDRPMRYGGFVWNETGARDGKVEITVDLRRQLLSVFKGGDEVGTAVILYGADGRPTPRGRFPILAKLRDHRSSSYDAAMPFTLRLTGDGVSIHGSNVRRGAATHGCIGVPTEFARLLFTVVRRGDPVVIA